MLFRSIRTTPSTLNVLFAGATKLVRFIDMCASTASSARRLYSDAVFSSKCMEVFVSFDSIAIRLIRQNYEIFGDKTAWRSPNGQFTGVSVHNFASQALGKAFVELVADGFLVEVLADEYEFDHAVAVDRIPVFFDIGIHFLELSKFLFRSCGIPVSGFGEFLLHTGLLEDIRHVGIVGDRKSVV